MVDTRKITSNFGEDASGETTDEQLNEIKALLAQASNTDSDDYEAKKRKNFYTRMWMQQLSGIATSLFSYENLPAEVPADWIEKTFLFYGGLIATQKPFLAPPMLDTKGTVFFYAATNGASLMDQYGLPLKVLATGPSFNGTWGTKEYDLRRYDDMGNIVTPEAILGMNSTNNLGIATNNVGYSIGQSTFEWQMIQGLADILAEYQMIQDVNISAQATPFILNGGQFSKKGSKNLIRQIQSGVKYIYNNNPGDKKNNPLSTDDDIKVLNTQAPFVAERIQELILVRYNDALTRLGLPAVTYKRERVVVSEATANNSQSALIADNKLKLREKFVNDINEAYGTDIKVSINLSDDEPNEIAQTDENRDLSDNVDTKESEGE